MTVSLRVKIGVKKFLLGLDEGLFLVSNVKDIAGNPVIAEETVSLPERDKQWKRITDTAAKIKRTMKPPVANRVFNLQEKTLNESFRLHREIYKVNRRTLETYQ